jgi:hypothetical protein
MKYLLETHRLVLHHVACVHFGGSVMMGVGFKDTEHELSRKGFIHGWFNHHDG